MPVITTIGSASAKGFGFAAGSAPGLYPFTTFTFTNASATGSTGPSLSNCLSAYGTSTYPWLTNTAFFNMVTTGIQLWTVPKSGSFSIECVGARGGYNGFGDGGRGARIITNVSLLAGEVLAIVVGQAGADNGQATNYNSGPGGGGGSFVYNNSTITYYAVAGGGGGAKTSNTNLTSTQADADGKATSTSGTSITDAGGFISLGGTNGGGGGISSRGILYGGGGAGIGAVGGGTSGGYSRTGGWTGNPAVYAGGFGGGGSSFGEAGYTNYKWGGGGGGYSGGACGHNGGNSDGQYGGGGGSYYIGSLQTATNGYQNGMGYVKITAL